MGAGASAGGGPARGIILYSLASRHYEQLTLISTRPTWLNDNRRLLFTHQGKLHLLDSQSKKIREVLSLPGNSVGSFSISPDSRRLYFSLSRVEADVWLLTLG